VFLLKWGITEVWGFLSISKNCGRLYDKASHLEELFYLASF